jgi:hypothetical protein
MAVLDYSNPKSEQGGDGSALSAAIGAAITPLLFAALAWILGGSTGIASVAGFFAAVTVLMCTPASVIYLCIYVGSAWSKLISAEDRGRRWAAVGFAILLISIDVLILFAAVETARQMQLIP